MTRHGRNNTASAVYSYHERKSDEKASGYGTLHLRLGKDSIRPFDCCCLTLQPCRDPVITPDGYLYDKEAILEYIVTKKAEIAKQEKEHAKQLKKEKGEAASYSQMEELDKVQKFLAQERGVNFKNSDSASGSGLSNMSGEKAKELPAFWAPSQTPDSKPRKIPKPDKNVYCPMSGNPLKMKDLIPVKFTPIKDGDSKTSLISKTNRYVCPVTNDILSNSVPCAVLKPTGDVVTMDCGEKIIKKDMMHPLTSEKLTDKDIIPLQRVSRILEYLLVPYMTRLPNLKL
ncbi:nitric oxide synthase-interacting protein homolog isoform X2 [Artemia franciscana]|uniref:nitric oxide synthase-interacting protein homolog isoform X2 n=1 Tax=Artemia franciscana TaxID=6661 RepID=UPI0032DABC87